MLSKSKILTFSNSLTRSKWRAQARAHVLILMKRAHEACTFSGGDVKQEAQ